MTVEKWKGLENTVLIHSAFKILCKANIDIRPCGHPASRLQISGRLNIMGKYRKGQRKQWSLSLTTDSRSREA